MKRAETGDPAAQHLTPETWNAFIDAAEAHQTDQQNVSQTTTQKQRDYASILVRNNSVNNCPRFAVIGLDEPIITPTDNLPEFKNVLAFKGRRVVVPDHLGKVAITQEAIPLGAIGRATLAGITPVQVDIVDDTHEYADAKHWYYSRLESCASGYAKILWREPGTGLKWALVSLGHGKTSATTFGYGKLTENLLWKDSAWLRHPATMAICNADGTTTGSEEEVYAPATWRDWDCIPEGVQIEWVLLDGLRVAQTKPGPIANVPSGCPKHGVIEVGILVAEYAALFYEGFGKRDQTVTWRQWRDCVVSLAGDTPGSIVPVTFAIDRPAKVRIHTPNLTDSLSGPVEQGAARGTWGLAMTEDFSGGYPPGHPIFKPFVLYQYLPGFSLSHYLRESVDGTSTEYGTATAIKDQMGTGYIKTISSETLSRYDYFNAYPCSMTGTPAYDGTNNKFPMMRIRFRCMIPANVTAVIPAGEVLEYSWRSGEALTFDMSAYYV